MTFQQVDPVAVSTTDSDVTSGRDDRREVAVATPVDNRTAEKQLSAEHKPEATNRSHRDTTPHNRKRKEKTKTAADVIATAEKRPSSKQEMNGGDHNTILNVPQCADTSCTETAVSDDVTDVDEPLPTTETDR